MFTFSVLYILSSKCEATFDLCFDILSQLEIYICGLMKENRKNEETYHYLQILHKKGRRNIKRTYCKTVNYS